MTKVVLVVALAVLALAGTALAERGPTKTERAAIRAAVKGYVQMPGSPAAKDNTILSVSVSTLDPRYAVARLNSKSAGRADLLFHESHATWWAVGFGSSMGCDSAPKAVLADLRVGCDPPYATAWINDCGALVSAPKSFVLTCADANYELAALNWHAWGSPTATATATVHSNDCTPNCAAGHFHSYKANVAADRLIACGKARIYARLTISYPGARPAGIPKRDVQTLGC
jgi:hypothetical protein